MMRCCRSCCSMTTSKVGGALRSRTLFCVPRRRASSDRKIIDGFRDIAVNDEMLPVLLLDDHIEGGRRLALQNAFLRPSAARLFVTERYRLDAAQQVRKRWV